jgi:Planctomycete cytochrome C
MTRRTLSIVSVVASGLSLAGASAIMPIEKACAQPANVRDQISYSEDIVPIFKGWCDTCHQPGGQGYEASRVDLTTYAGLMKGTKFGPVVIPKEPDSSSLIALIYGRTSPKIRMPFGHKPLPDCLRSNIWTWIFQGAKNN